MARGERHCGGRTKTAQIHHFIPDDPVDSLFPPLADEIYMRVINGENGRVTEKSVREVVRGDTAVIRTIDVHEVDVIFPLAVNGGDRIYQTFPRVRPAGQTLGAGILGQPSLTSAVRINYEQIIAAVGPGGIFKSFKYNSFSIRA
jgi:hypothetical protein